MSKRGGSALAVLLLAGCARQPAQGRPVRVSAQPYLSHAPLILALQNGDFATEGVTVELQAAGRASEAMVAVATGDVDVMAGNVTVGLLHMAARGVPARIVADKGGAVVTACVDSGLVIRTDLADRLRDPQRLRGLRIAISRAVPSDYSLELLLTPLGLAASDFRRYELPAAERVRALTAGELDISQLNEPWLMQALQSGVARLWSQNDPRVPGAVLIFGKRLLQDDRALGRRFLAAYLRGVARSRQGKTAHNVDVMTRYTGLARTIVEQACWPEVSHDARIDVESLRGFAAWARRRGYLDHDVDVAQAVDLGLLDELAAASRP